MANYYTSGSIAVDIAKLDVAQVKTVIERVTASIVLGQYEERIIESPGIDWDIDDCEAGYTTEIDDRDGVLYVYEECSFNPEDVERLLSEFAAAFDIQEPFTATWCELCDKPRPNAFKGGGFVVQLGKPTKWFSVDEQITDYLNEIKATSERNF